MKKNNILMTALLRTVICLLLFTLQGCENFLEIRPDKKMVIATKLDDLQAIFDNTGVIKPQANLVEVIADSYYLSDADYMAQSVVTRQYYVRETPLIDYSQGWTSYYRTIFYVNEILAGLQKIGYSAIELPKARHLEGSALFVRALSYYHLAQLFTVPYDDATVVNEKGLPLRLSPDFNQVVKRSSQLGTYQQIIADFRNSIRLLPVTKPTYPTRPWKAAAYAGLANVYLTMENYALAETYADSVLQITNQLMDFSMLDQQAEVPFLPYNAEVLYFSNFGQVGPLSNRLLNVDTLLYRSYADADLRKSVYFKLRTNGTVQYKGDYLIQNQSFFNGLTIAEMLLVRAECKARRGDSNGAAQDLKKLMDSRWTANHYVIPGNLNDAGILNLILEERRRELVFKGRRWYDIRRLHGASDKSIKLSRKIGDETYEISSSDNSLNTLNIPDEVRQLGGYDQ
ncbi:RagB/SusD family nutrient uptake outer membrane protein [Sphingobacterium pedocola]|uniref:RagB/SusD family nutrient uptake outer membrane protein n=1 Tax=Sphingobacterium pedocola TaxID=2082722 RepID=A0ABR9T6B2_9SPHI|nr:RagB/SusD family nutrient uptake outer membrane protein [Sphingobacterium pedocola]MBE8720860.1 hypothetical protein [Sphingobacterium pedocola]